jgi:hypothetical protein
MTQTLDSRRRWLALIVLCLGDLMIVLDSTIVNVALPSIRANLGFSETSLVWVVNAYLLTFGGFLLLGGGSAISMAIAGCSSPGSSSSRLPRSAADWRKHRPCSSPPVRCRASAAPSSRRSRCRSS